VKGYVWRRGRRGLNSSSTDRDFRHKSNEMLILWLPEGRLPVQLTVASQHDIDGRTLMLAALTHCVK
jgi:hypothetical protein